MCRAVNPPTPLVGAGRAIGALGALAVEICILAKTSYAYSSARGELFFSRMRGYG